MQRRGSRQLTVDTPYMQYDIELQIETPCLFCPHCSKYAVVRPQCIHSKRCMTLRLMGYIARLMQETSAIPKPFYKENLPYIRQSCAIEARYRASMG